MKKILGNIVIILITIFLYALLDIVTNGFLTSGLFMYPFVVLAITFAVLASKKLGDFLNKEK